MNTLARTLLASWLVVFTGCVSSRSSLPAREPSPRLRLIGVSDLGGQGFNGDIAVVGRTALVATGIHPGAGIHAHFYNPYPCGKSEVKIVDLADAANPRVVATIPVAAGVIPIDVDAIEMNTAYFHGVLAAVALARCGSEGDFVERGVAYYDISNRAEPRFLGRYQSDSDMAGPDAPPCGPKPGGSGERCASSQHSVSLMRHANGKILSLSTEPGASSSGFVSGDLRIVDVTDPKHPVQIAAYPNEVKGLRSPNGCRPFSAGHSVSAAGDGSTAYVAWYDQGVMAIDLSDPGKPTLRSQFGFKPERTLEGNAAYVTAATVKGRKLALLSEEDWIPTLTKMRVTKPASIARSRMVCEAVFTIFDANRDAAIFTRPSGRIEGEVVYLGRGCLANPGSGGHSGTSTTDPVLADAHGKIVLMDRTRHDGQPSIPPGPGCSAVERGRRAQEAGAIAVLIAQTVDTSPEAFSPDGLAHDLSIPVMQVDKDDADLLRTTLCPEGADSRCVGGRSVSVELVDSAGDWGALRVVDMTEKTPVQTGWYQTPASHLFPPRDLGVYSVHHAAVDGALAFVAANSDGLRVLDLERNASEIASFVPEDRKDPNGILPGKSYVTGVALVPGTKLVVITDMHSGLYVLERP